MNEQHFRSAVMACAFSVGPMLPPAMPLWAQIENSSLSSAQIDALIEDIKEFKQSCDSPAQSVTALCTTQKADLIARQKGLNITDDEISDKLKSNGWRWP